MDVVYTVEVADKEEEEEEEGDGEKDENGEKKTGDDNDSQTPISETKRGKQKVTSQINVQLGPLSHKNKRMALKDDDDDL